MEEGRRELLESAYSDVFRDAANDPERLATFTLAAIVTHRVNHYCKWDSQEDEDLRALTFAGNPAYLDRIQKDPTEYLRHFKATRRKLEELIQRTLSELST